MALIEREILYELYITQNKPMHEVASDLNIAVGSVYNYIKLYDIPARPPHMGFKGKAHTKEAREKLSKVHKGKMVSIESRRKISAASKKGGVGHKKKRRDGYIALYFPDHPRSNKDGYIMEHDLIAECLIGRPLKEDEVVHHKNAIKDDNRKENLMVMTKSEHMSYHSKLRWEEIKCSTK